MEMPILLDRIRSRREVCQSPNIPTTAEMDGQLTQKDMRMRDQVIYQCFTCCRWTQHKQGEPFTACTGLIEGQPYVDGRGKVQPGCGEKNYDRTSIKSVRSYNKDTDNKRKPKVQKKKR